MHIHPTRSTNCCEASRLLLAERGIQSVHSPRQHCQIDVPAINSQDACLRSVAHHITSVEHSSVRHCSAGEVGGNGVRQSEPHLGTTEDLPPAAQYRKSLMTNQDDQPDPIQRKASLFATTHWTEILEAVSGHRNGASEAMGQLYRDYWQPVCALIRMRGYGPEDAEDIAQDFLISCIEKERFSGITREGGRFRSFLLTGLKNFLANEWDRRTALKRGGKQRPISMEENDLDDRLPQNNDHGLPPDQAFDRQWAETMVDRCLSRLRSELIRRGRSTWWEWVRPALQGEGTSKPYAEIAAEVNLSEGAIKVAIHRMRSRYGEILREEIRRTVARDEDIPEELNYLIEVLSR